MFECEAQPVGVSMVVLVEDMVLNRGRLVEPTSKR
jgi:hypothetical protein